MQLADNSSQAILAWQQSGQEAQAWLDRHCEQAPSPDGVVVAEGLVIWRQGTSWLPVALWPARADGKALLGLAEDVRQAGRGMLVQLFDSHIGLGYPIHDIAGESRSGLDPETAAETADLMGVVVLRIAPPEASSEEMERLQPALMALMARLEDGVAVLERNVLGRHHRRALQAHAQLSNHLELLTAMLAEQRFRSAGMQLVTRLASRLDADRVTLGWRRGSSTRAVQVSHSAQFNRKMNRVRATEAAMDESLDQLTAVWLPEVDDGSALRPGSVVSRAHSELLEMTEGQAVLTVPCLDESRALGALTLERERPFSADEIMALESLAALSARALEEKRLNDRSLPIKLIASVGQAFGKLVGPGHLGIKLFSLVLALIIAGATFATGTDSVAADATLESREQRILSAPYRGYIEETLVRPGDRVDAGQPLARMDTRDLELERLEWQSELAKFAGQEQEMRALGDRAALNVLAAQRDQAQARLALVESRLSRATLLAPFDGVVLAGDLTQRLGGSSEAGEELFRLAPLEGLRIELEVPESRIDDIAVGQRGELVLAAMTETRLPLEVERLTPQMRSAEGHNRFIVEGRLDETEMSEALQTLRPGMQGVGRVEIGEERLIAIWTRELVAWVRLNVWRWLG